MLRKVLRRSRRGIQYVKHTEGDAAEMFNAICKLGLEGIVSKKLDAPYKSEPSKAWLKIKNPNAPAATRAIELAHLSPFFGSYSSIASMTYTVAFSSSHFFCFSCCLVLGLKFRVSAD